MPAASEERQQSAVTAFLADPTTHGGAAVQRVDTHISRLFLAGDRVYKMKRAVRLPFLDFTTLAAREAACRAELTVNRRTAPALYRAVHAVIADRRGGFALDGPFDVMGGDVMGGDVVEWVVEMARFDERTLFDRLAERGGLTDDLVYALADAVAALHAGAELRPTFGGAAGFTMWWSPTTPVFATWPAGRSTDTRPTV